jgi:gamma-glutamyltranspeptidase
LSFLVLLHSGVSFGQWSKQDLSRYLVLQNGFDPELRKRVEPQRSATGSRAMIAGTSEPLAVHAGLEVLRRGGNAADAALTTALAQVALSAGAAISYAGILTAVYYDAATGKVYTLNACYNTVLNEKDPLSIPGFGEHSGRTALVPGFMAGVQALHDRFGKLPFSMLFGAAIWIAENGVAVNAPVSFWISSQKNFITRLPEKKRVFTRPDGELYKSGDLFRQPELAATLRKVAAGGSAYMYKGEWARHFVDHVQREGGQMTLDDLATYRAKNRKLPVISALAVDERRSNIALRETEAGCVADAPVKGVHFNREARGQSHFNGRTHNLGPRFVVLSDGAAERNAAFHPNRNGLRRSGAHSKNEH